MIAVTATDAQHAVPSTITVSSVKLPRCFECIIMFCRLHSQKCSCSHALLNVLSISHKGRDKLCKCLVMAAVLSGVRGPSAGPLAQLNWPTRSSSFFLEYSWYTLQPVQKATSFPAFYLYSNNPWWMDLSWPGHLRSWNAGDVTSFILIISNEK